MISDNDKENKQQMINMCNFFKPLRKIIYIYNYFLYIQKIFYIYF